jgi:type I site-specific restriction endonuclease
LTGLPEQIARNHVDRLLTDAGWALQDRSDFDRNAALGVAVREFQLPAGPCDYLLFVAGKAAGVIEAKKTGVTLSGVAEQSEKYMARLPEHLARWQDILVYDYESTGEETFFRNMRDPKPRSRRLFAFHRPETRCTCGRDRGKLGGGARAISKREPGNGGGTRMTAGVVGQGHRILQIWTMPCREEGPGARR